MESTKNLKLTLTTMGHVDVKTAIRYQHPETGHISHIMNRRNAKQKTATTDHGHSFGHREVVIQEKQPSAVEYYGADERS